MSCAVVIPADSSVTTSTEVKSLLFLSVELKCAFPPLSPDRGVLTSSSALSCSYDSAPKSPFQNECELTYSKNQKNGSLHPCHHREREDRACYGRRWDPSFGQYHHLSCPPCPPCPPSFSWFAILLHGTLEPRRGGLARSRSDGARVGQEIEKAIPFALSVGVGEYRPDVMKRKK